MTTWLAYLSLALAISALLSVNRLRRKVVALESRKPAVPMSLADIGSMRGQLVVVNEEVRKLREVVGLIEANPALLVTPASTAETIRRIGVLETALSAVPTAASIAELIKGLEAAHAERDRRVVAVEKRLGDVCGEFTSIADIFTDAAAWIRKSAPSDAPDLESRPA